MKAIIQTGYGAAEDVLRLGELDVPTMGDDDVLVRVHAASVNAADWRLVRASPWMIRLAYGLQRPRHQVPGADLAGTVEQVGPNVTRFAPGDEVFGDTSGDGFGAFAEYASVPEDSLASKPTNLTMEQAAAVPMAAVTALQGLRDHGNIRAGQKVLVNGASGGVGTFAVQIAKALGAEVTGVCSTRNLEIVRSLGADHVIDYTKEDFTQGTERYDLILDTAAYRPMKAHIDALGATGHYILVGGSMGPTFQTMLLGPLRSKAKGQRFASMLAKPSHQDLTVVKDMIEKATIGPVMDQRFGLVRLPRLIVGHPPDHGLGGRLG